MLLEGRSSRLLRQEFHRWRGARMRSLWSASWFVSTVGRLRWKDFVEKASSSLVRSLLDDT